MKEYGLTLNHQSKISSRTICRRKSSIFFDTIRNLHREQDGAIQFYKIKFHLREYPPQTQNWSGDRWLACLAAGGGSKRRYQYRSDTWDQSFISVLFKGHSGDNIIDLEMQDHVLITPGIFPYVYHVGSNFNIPSILSNGLIPGGVELSGRQSVFFLPTDPRDENYQDPENIDLFCAASCSIHAKNRGKGTRTQ